MIASALNFQKNTAGGGVPSVTSAGRGQACLQVAPCYLPNSGRVGADCAARPAFSGGVYA